MKDPGIHPVEHHHKDCGCGCGHHHHEAVTVADHHETCGCGHHHQDGDTHGEHQGCGCGHDHDGDTEAEPHHAHHLTTNKAITKTYTILNLDCANCAAKMESRIAALPGVSHASVAFATNTLRLSAENPDALLPEITRLCQQIEGAVTLVPRETAGKKKEPASKASLFKGEGLQLLGLIVGALLFVGTEVYHEVFNVPISTPLLLLFILAYLILGGEIIWTALRNLFKGQVFDENFLMAVATLGAFAIQQYPEAVGVMLFFRIGEFFEHVAVERSRSQIMEAVDLRPEVVNRVEGDSLFTLDAKDAQVGDILLVRPGDRIPLDGVVVTGESRIDTSAITGEPVPVGVHPGSALTSGCVNTTGALTMAVQKVLSESMVTRILDSVENAAASKPKIDNFISRFARVYTPVVVAIALFTAVGIPLITGQAFYPWVYTALSFLVMSCPCALVLSVPLAFFCGIGAGSKRGILFKGGVVMEALTKVKALVMDKTGTITVGNFAVQAILPQPGFTAESLLLAAATCELTSTHPIATSIVTHARGLGLSPQSPIQLKEVAGKGIWAKTQDQVLLCGNEKLLNGEGITLPTQDSQGGGTQVLVAIDGCYAGQIIIADTIKAEAAHAIAQVKGQHIVTAMLTGDALASAQAVAEATGVEEVHARLLPQDKLSTLGEIRAAHGPVLFVGDGINDAPVLAGADVGAAMGSGADAAIEAADVVFMNSNLDAIPTAIALARLTVGISWQNVIFALTVKIIVMILGLTGIYANMWLAVFADTGVAFLCILNSIRVLYAKIK